MLVCFFLSKSRIFLYNFRILVKIFFLLRIIRKNEEIPLWSPPWLTLLQNLYALNVQCIATTLTQLPMYAFIHNICANAFISSFIFWLQFCDCREKWKLQTMPCTLYECVRKYGICYDFVHQNYKLKQMLAMTNAIWPKFHMMQGKAIVVHNALRVNANTKLKGRAHTHTHNTMRVYVSVHFDCLFSNTKT